MDGHTRQLTMQRALSLDQVRAFYHDEFVAEQTLDFVSLVGETDARVVVDVGGGVGFFASSLAQRGGHKVRVIDLDAGSIAACQERGIEVVRGDALDPPIAGDEDIVTFNLILHHLVAGSERATMELQCRALAVWSEQVRAVFVNEYIYDSYIDGLSGRLIYHVTKSRLLSWAAALVARVVPSLRANTFGTGVRFRSRKDWLRLFASAGYEVMSSVQGKAENVSMSRRLLLIKDIRRDSFLLRPRSIT
jgi:SAM-dependent methyltransferase